jgi:hypothetical protein
LNHGAAAAVRVAIRGLPRELERAGEPFQASSTLPVAHEGGDTGKRASHVNGLLVGLL